MCKYSKQIIKKINQLQSIKTDIRSSLETINTLVIFTNKIQKKKRKINIDELNFVERKILLLMKELNTTISRKEFKLLIECIDLISSKREIDDIEVINKFGSLALNYNDEPEEEQINQVKVLDYKLVEKLESNLKSRIFSQDKAIKKVVDGIKINISGLGESNKPIGSFLFTGSTGVGKTELAKELARQLNIDFIRFDMSEYNNSELGTIKLIGAPVGYKGHELGGLLTNAILEKPSAVLLLDEIEKAHPELMSIFLQMMDNAQITDGKGNKVSFKNIIIIMTSNLGVKSEPVVGFAKSEDTATNKAVKEFFSPEFINRLDTIVNFNFLEPGASLNIVNKFLLDISAILNKKNINMKLSDKAKKKLSILGFNKDMGARAINRVVLSNIKMPISEEVLYGSLKNGGDVYIDCINEEFIFKYNEYI